MLDELMRHIEHGRIRNQQSPLAPVSSEINTANDKGLCHVTPTPPDLLVSPFKDTMKEVHWDKTLLPSPR
ncbi:hypothetical protein AB0451_38355 [Streptomyces sp. NPDC052000]|uniref:hypothetical protein n=1 Tax=Streptomyces sp. NPDC052000 TaxID=3155676 RepID=UPI0034501F65